MALFHIERFGETVPKLSKEEQFKRLQEKIEKRKSLNSPHIKSSPIVRNVNSADSEDKSCDNETIIKESGKKRKNNIDAIISSTKKKKKKEKSLVSDDETNNKIGDNSYTEKAIDAVISSTKKKKKKKKSFVSDDESNNKISDDSHAENASSPSREENEMILSSSNLLDHDSNSPEKSDAANYSAVEDNINGNKPLTEEIKNLENKNEAFTILHKHKKTKKTEIEWTLPRWMANPVHISSNMKDKKSTDELTYLSNELKDALTRNNITALFPVQHSVIPKILSEYSNLNRYYFQPCDMCVQAPTGSGKTLSYVLPIVHILSKRLISQLACIVVLPSTDLAKQVKQVFDSIIQGSSFPIKVALVTGLNTFAKEQKKLVQKSVLGDKNVCKVDIVVCTPGRLVDHMNRTEGFTMENLQFLVIDEADKLLSQDYSGWLELLLNKVYKSSVSFNSPGLRNRLMPINAAKFQYNQLPLHKLLFSATLTQNPGKLAPLSLYNPIFFITKNMSVPHHIEENELTNEDISANGIVNDNKERFTLPENLTQQMIVVKSSDLKPLVLLHVLLTNNYDKIVCFTKSVEATHRLFLLLQEYGGFKVSEFSSNLSEVQRKGIIRDFKEGSVDIIVSSDVMARGMHINNVQLVVNYDAPANEKSYVHRIGRTARAGAKGEAITILASKEAYHFKKMCQTLPTKCTRMKLDTTVFSQYEEQYEKALEALKKRVIEEKRDKKIKFVRK